MVTSMPASAHNRATVAAWSSDPPASTSARSRQARTWTRRSPASAARSPSLSIDARRTSAPPVRVPAHVLARPATLRPGLRGLRDRGRKPDACCTDGATAACDRWCRALRRAALAFSSASGVPRSRPSCSTPARNRRRRGLHPDRRPSSLVARRAHAVRSPAWTAADLTGSVPLTDGRTLWLYGDTITAASARPAVPCRGRSRPATRPSSRTGCLTPLLQGSGPAAGIVDPASGPSGTGPGTGTPGAGRCGCTRRGSAPSVRAVRLPGPGRRPGRDRPGHPEDPPVHRNRYARRRCCSARA